MRGTMAVSVHTCINVCMNMRGRVIASVWAKTETFVLKMGVYFDFKIFYFAIVCVCEIKERENHISMRYTHKSNNKV